ncbi:MAG: RNA-binding domain-containing protein [Candidatus Heimdallarchaeaceae archaeon]|jgi:RNA binding exosome subunit
MEITVTKLVISFSVHATEDLEKNMESLSSIFPDGILENTEVNIDELEGGYQNPIEFVSFSFTKASTIEKILRYFSSITPNEEKTKLGIEFDERFDQKNNMFYIRLDKEELFHGNVVITSSANIIKLAIKMRAFIKDVNFKKFLIDKNILI